MINRYKFLGFFDKDGSDLNFVFDEETGIWEGSINIPGDRDWETRWI